MIKVILRNLLKLQMLRDQDHLGKKLQASQSCPTCDFTGERKLIMAVQDDPYLECPSCRGCSISSMSTVTFLAKYYDRYYEPVGQKITFPSIAGRFANHIAKKLLPFSLLLIPMPL